MRIKLAIPITQKELISATGARPKSNTERIITHISPDTRELSANDLFVGIPGKNYSDTDFIGEAKSIGALTISSSDLSDYTVKNPRNVLLQLAEYYKTKLPKLTKTIAISGSFGKTTTKSFLSAVLSKKYKVHSSESNNNNDIGLPLTILSAPLDCEILILECGTSGFGEIKALAKCARPDIAIITAIGTSHIAAFGSREVIAREKLDILAFGAPLLIHPENEPLLNVPYQLTVGEGWCRRRSIRFIENSSRLWLEVPSACIPLPFTNKALISPLMLALATAEVLGLNSDEMINGTKEIGESDLRYKIIPLSRYTIIDDAYNASPETILAAVDNLLSLPFLYRSALIGDVLELGIHTEAILNRLGGELAKRCLNRLLLYGSYKTFVLDGIKEAKGNIKDVILLSGTVDDIAPKLNELLLDGEILLIKGSHGTELYKLADKLVALNK